MCFCTSRLRSKNTYSYKYRISRNLFVKTKSKNIGYFLFLCLVLICIIKLNYIKTIPYTYYRMQSIDIVSLIESNPITKLSNVYNNKFLLKIKENFTEMEQQLFVSSCYCYLNYNQSTDFVIDLDNIWKWLGFNQKYNAKRVLEKHFILDKDYKNLMCDSVKQKNEEGRGGHNKETIMLTVKTFKLFFQCSFSCIFLRKS